MDQARAQKHKAMFVVLFDEEEEACAPTPEPFTEPQEEDDMPVVTIDASFHKTYKCPGEQWIVPREPIFDSTDLKDAPTYSGNSEESEIPCAQPPAEEPISPEVPREPSPTQDSDMPEIDLNTQTRKIYRALRNRTVEMEIKFGKPTIRNTPIFPELEMCSQPTGFEESCIHPAPKRARVF